MNLSVRLSQRIRMSDIHEIISWSQGSDERKKQLYDLLFDEEDIVAYQAGWVCSHFGPDENSWLYDKREELIDEVLICQHPGKRRLLLTLLFRQPAMEPPRVDFLDFCMERMISREELPGVQSLCMKLAYGLCRSIPELLKEYQALLEIMEPHLLPTSMRTVRKNVLKAMKAGKSLQPITTVI